MDPWGNIAQLNIKEISDLQSRRLSHFINSYLYPFSAHYQNVFKEHKIDPRSIRTVNDLQKIPFTSKSDFIDDSNPNKVRDFILQPDGDKIRKFWPIHKLLKMKMIATIKGDNFIKEKLEKEFRPCFITFTTGTTNRPVSFLYSNYDIGNLNISGARMLRLFDLKGDDYIVNMFPYAPHLAIWQVVFGGLASNVLVLSTGGGKVMGTEGNISVIGKMKPAVLMGVPGYVYHVLRVAKERGIKLDFVKKIVLGASSTSTAFKCKLSEILESCGAKNTSIFGTYGFTEARSAWAECPTANDVSSGYHVYPDKEIFEIINSKTGEVLKEGESGELVYTSLDSRASSVLRYRTGDFVVGGITTSPCPHCKRTVPRISNQITRISDVKDMQVSKIKGALVDFNNFSICLSEFEDIDEWQIELCKKDDDPFEIDQLLVYISCRNSVNKVALKEAVKKKLLLVTEVTPNEVTFLPLDEMVNRLELETANKEKRIVDRRPKE